MVSCSQFCGLSRRVKVLEEASPGSGSASATKVWIFEERYTGDESLVVPSPSRGTDGFATRSFTTTVHAHDDVAVGFTGDPDAHGAFANICIHIPGTFLIDASSPCDNGGMHQIVLWGVEDGLIVAHGSTESAPVVENPTARAVTRSQVHGCVQVSTAPATFNIRHYIQIADNAALGRISTIGEHDVFSMIRITQIA